MTVSFLTKERLILMFSSSLNSLTKIDWWTLIGQEFGSYYSKCSDLKIASNYNFLFFRTSNANLVSMSEDFVISKVQIHFILLHVSFHLPTLLVFKSPRKFFLLLSLDRHFLFLFPFQVFPGIKWCSNFCTKFSRSQSVTERNCCFNISQGNGFIDFLLKTRLWS